MKYLIILFFTFFTKVTFGQTFIDNFLGRDFLNYKEMFFTINKERSSGSYDYAFYPNMQECKLGSRGKVSFPSSDYNFVTNKDSLLGKIFLVENIVNTDSLVWNSEMRSGVINKPIFILRDTLTNQKIYYKYESDYSSSFPFLVCSVSKNGENILCNLIEEKKDDFTNVKKFNSPILDKYNTINSIIIYKDLKKGKETYYLSLRSYGSTLTINQKSVIVLFQDGTKWTKSENIDVDAENSGFTYSTYVPLTIADLKLLSIKKIKKIRLYIHDSEIDEMESDKFITFVNCIKSKK